MPAEAQCHCSSVCGRRQLHGWVSNHYTDHLQTDKKTNHPVPVETAVFPPCLRPAPRRAPVEGRRVPQGHTTLRSPGPGSRRHPTRSRGRRRARGRRTTETPPPRGSPGPRESLPSARPRPDPGPGAVKHGGAGLRASAASRPCQSPSYLRAADRDGDAASQRGDPLLEEGPETARRDGAREERAGAPLK